MRITPVEMHDTGREETLGLPLWDLWDTLSHRTRLPVFSIVIEQAII